MTEIEKDHRVDGGDLEVSVTGYLNWGSNNSLENSTDLDYNFRSFVLGAVLSRWEVAKNIWPYMLTIGFAYFITLCLYPGIESEIVSCRFKSWMPVIIMAIFNASDLAGKVSNFVIKSFDC